MKVTPVEKKFGKYRPGDEFELPDKAAQIFIRVGKLREVTAVVAEPEIHAEPEISPRTGRPKRTYRRRDMQAET